MHRLVPTLLACSLFPAAHAAPQTTPAQVQVKITEVESPAALPATFTPVKDPATGAPDDLLALQQAAAKAKVTLTVTPGPTLTTTDGVKGALDTQTKYPFTATDAAGKKQRAFQTLGSGVSALPHINADGTVTVQLSVTQTEEAGPPATPDGPLPTTTQSFSTLRTFADGQTNIIGRSDMTTHDRAGLTIQSSRLVFATVTIVPPKKP